MDRIVGASADYLKSLLSTRKAQSGDSREDGSSRSDDYEHGSGSYPDSPSRSRGSPRIGVPRVDNEELLNAMSESLSAVEIDDLMSRLQARRQAAALNAGGSNPSDGKYDDRVVSGEVASKKLDRNFDQGYQDSSPDWATLKMGNTPSPEFTRAAPSTSLKEEKTSPKISQELFREVSSSPKKDIRMKLDMLIKNMINKGLELTGEDNFIAWMKGIKEIGHYRGWPLSFWQPRDQYELLQVDTMEEVVHRQEAFLTIQSTISKSITFMMENIPFAHVEEAIALFQDKFGVVTELQKGMLSSKFWALTQESTGLDVDGFIEKIKTEAQRCRDAGQEMNERAMSAALLKGLLPDFQSIKGTLSLGKEYIGNFRLTAAAISNYAKDNGIANKKVNKSKPSGMALAIGTGRICFKWLTTGKCDRGDKCIFKKSHTARKPNTCFGCGEAGHWIKDCKKPKAQKLLASPNFVAAMVSAREEDEQQAKSGPEKKEKGPYSMPVIFSVNAPVRDGKELIGLDSCASSHMWNVISDFVPGSIRQVDMTFTLGSDAVLRVKQVGDVMISQGEHGEVLLLKDVAFSKDLPLKLISFGRLMKAGVSSAHNGQNIEISKDGTKLLEAFVHNNVVVLDDVYVCDKKGRRVLNAINRENDFLGEENNESQIFTTPGEASRLLKIEMQQKSLTEDSSTVPADKFLAKKNSDQIVNKAMQAIAEVDAGSDIIDQEAHGETEKQVFDEPIGGPDLIRGAPDVKELSYMDVHIRYGHVNLKTCFDIMGLPPPDKNSPVIQCESCQREKQNLQSIPDNAQSRASLPLYRVHIDSSGKRISTEGGNQYFVVIVDDFSRKGWLILSQTKEEIPTKIVTKLKQLMSQRPGLKVAFARTDGAGEYMQKEFIASLTEIGCTFEKSAPYRQAQNGVAEARIGLISKMARCMMNFSSVNHPVSDWGYAVTHANMIVNLIPTQANKGLSPDEVWGDPRSRLPIPGPLFCAGFAKSYKRGKMESEAQKVMYMGNGEDFKAYLVRPLEGPSDQVRASRDVTFFPSVMPYSHPLVKRPVNAADEAEVKPDEAHVEPEEVPQEPCEEYKYTKTELNANAPEYKPQGEVLPPSEISRGFSPGSKVYVVDKHEGTGKWKVYEVIVDSVRDDGVYVKFRRKKDAYLYHQDVDVFRSRAQAEKLLETTEKAAYPVMEQGSIFLNASTDEMQELAQSIEKDPVSREEMLNHPHREGYIDAEVVEMEQLLAQKVYELVERKRDMNVLGNRWVYKAKRAPTSGEISKFRSRLVAKGFKERFGIEFTETFSSNIRMDAVRLMLALVAYYDLDCWHFDIRAYFLHGELEEDIYMEQPEGYHEGPVKGQPGELVCKLIKAIYGTKQAQRCADKVLRKAFAEAGVYPIATDDSMYYARDGDKIFMCGMHVDDGLCLSNDADFATGKINSLKKVFELVVVKDPKIYVGIQIERDRAKGTILLHQEDSVLKLLASSGLMDCKSAATPMQTGLNLKEPKEVVTGADERHFPYQSLVGQLIWLLGTRIDLSFPINVLTRYMSGWDAEAISLLKRVIRYLKGKEKMGLIYLKSQKGEKLERADEEPTKFSCAGDADHAGRVHDSKTTAGVMGLFADNVVSFNTKAHPIGVSTSSSQAEGVTCKLACQSVEFTSSQLTELKIRGRGPITLYQDNRSVICLAANPVNHKRSKHYRIAMHYVRDLVLRGVVKIQYLETLLMKADLLTKALPEKRLIDLLKLCRFGDVEG